MSQTSQSAAEWDRRYQAAELVWSLTPNEFVVSELEDLPVRSMVDVAGGEGRNALWFASRGILAENVEFSQVALDKFQARAESLGLTQLVRANLSDAKTAKFQLNPDLVLIAYLQLPWNELSLALDNALNQVAGGEIFGIWHARRNLKEGFGGPQAEALLPEPYQLRQWAIDHQLDHRVWEQERVVKTETGTFSAIDVILRAKEIR